MTATVYRFDVTETTAPAESRAGLEQILAREEICAAFSSKGLTAIKMHFGEADKPKTVAPDYVRIVASAVRKQGGKPFLTDTNTLYTGQRSNSVDHLNLAHRHGYTPQQTGAPVIIMDGLSGRNFFEVPIDGKHCQTAKIARDVLSIDDLIVLTHVTGHGGVGLGASIKNMGMGMASRGGKQIQHSGILPRVTAKKCVACGECARWCPADAITVDETAVIDPEKCIGCGECTVTCPHKAIAVRWDESSINLQEKMAEYALAVTRSIRGKCCFINFALNITKDCDCVHTAQEAQFAAIGIFASTDPVAVDQAVFDALRERQGSDVPQGWFGIDATVQLAHAEAIGLGTREYEVTKV